MTTNREMFAPARKPISTLEKKMMEKNSNPNIKRRMDYVTGKPLPMPCEITEGKAWLNMLRNPGSKSFEKIHAEAWNNVGKSSGDQCCGDRCADCGTYRWGLMEGDTCGNCDSGRIVRVRWDAAHGSYYWVMGTLQGKQFVPRREENIVEQKSDSA